MLVSTQDDRPAVKVIDFGVAKAIQARLTEKTLFTEFHQLVGTPAYMSPEQAEGSLDIDTRSDVYSLGVLLYELLAGTPPFNRRAALQSLRRNAANHPRSRAADAQHAAQHAHRRRCRRSPPNGRIEPPKTCGDSPRRAGLDRDESAGKRSHAPLRIGRRLARDIEHHLADEPVQACPPSAIYRFRSSVRRNRTPLAIGGAIATALVVGLGLFTWLYFRERAAVWWRSK